ncbi:BnaC02g11880D [Brassica napus]|uniref:BnaC02g11880D protein n=3 Tax=Brassica TaxID=3705 RepID=A0A078H5Z2_BRANA|nr:BnaC02g11880D [Brassica napus]VDD21167.1 unnamed protein product [Brassica oleracea]
MPSVVSLGKQFLLPLPCPVASRRRTPLSLRFPNRRWRSIPSQLEELLNQMEIDFVETKNPAFDRGEEEDVGKLRQGAKLVLELGPCKDCERYQYKSFELNIVFSQLSGRMGRLKAQYIQQISFLVVTVSQFTTLFQTTAYTGHITLGLFQFSAVVQVVGIILCLQAVTKISHRAQAIASVASKWHAIMLCSSTDTTQIRTSPSGVHLEATTNPPISFQN